MRILKIEFENINSIKGKWEIDFTNPNYQENHNIFVICGPTGSGKTSILDAVSLALYGKTPRQSVINNGEGGNEIMTRGTSSLYAKITYQCKKGVFTSSFTQRRARDKADGNLQKAEFAITDEKGVIIDSGAGKDLSAKTSQIVGLTYEQFCRSMLLAQGEFNRFLKCDNKERAAILEKLTGTERYRKVAVKICERSKEEQLAFDSLLEKKEELCGELLSDDEVTEYNSLSHSLQTQIEKIQNESETLKTILNWYIDIDAGKKKIDQCILEQNKYHFLLKEFESQAKKLERGEKALLSKGLYDAYERSKKALSDEKQSLVSEEKKSHDLNEQLVKAQNEKKAASEQKIIVNEQFAKDELLYKKVRALDLTLLSQKKQCDIVFDRLKDNRADIEKNQGKLNLLTEELTKLIDENKKAREYKNANKKDCDIASVIELIKAEIKDVEQKKAELITVTNNINSSNKKVDSIKETVRDLTQKLCEYDSYIKEHDKDKELSNLIAVWTYKLGDIEGIEKDLVEENEELSSLKCELENLNNEKSQKESEGKVLFDKMAAILQDKGAMLALFLQKTLQKGKPCCVCGSLEHPFMTKKSDDSVSDLVQISSLSDDINVLNSEKQTLDKKLSDISIKLSAVTEKYNHLKEKISEDKQKLALLFSEKDKAFSPWGKDIGLDTLCEKSSAYEKCLEDFSQCEQKLSKAKSELEIKESELKNYTDSYNDLSAALKRLIDNVKTKTQHFDINAEEENLSAIVDFLNERLEKWTLNEKVLSESEVAISSKNAAVTELTLVCEKLIDCEKEVSKEYDDKKASYDKTLYERTQALGEKNVDDEEALSKARLSDVEKSYESVCEKVNELSKISESSKVLLKKLFDNVDDLSITNENDKNEFNRKLCETGFENEQDYLSSLLTESEIQSLKNQKQKLSDDCLRSDTAKDQAQKDYDMLLAKHPDAKDRESTKASFDELKIKEEELSKKLLTVNTKLEQYKVNKLKFDELIKSFDRQMAINDKWKQLKEWIGDNKGDKFNIFVQSLAFTSLIAHANRYLQGITSRYLLKQKNAEDLDFELIDANFAKPRSVTNISGGESFMISLSLALGIAEFANRSIRVDTLFLDEGFGTLDNEKIACVIDVLRKLESSGKMLGVITHVDEVIAAIPQKIEVKPVTGGASIIIGDGITHFDK